MTRLYGWLDRADIISKVGRAGGGDTGQNGAFTHGWLFCLRKF
jgi:hypothetical protein